MCWCVIIQFSDSPQRKSCYFCWARSHISAGKWLTPLNCCQKLAATDCVPTSGWLLVCTLHSTETRLSLVVSWEMGWLSPDAKSEDIERCIAMAMWTSGIWLYQNVSQVRCPLRLPCVSSWHKWRGGWSGLRHQGLHTQDQDPCPQHRGDLEQVRVE